MSPVCTTMLISPDMVIVSSSSRTGTALQLSARPPSGIDGPRSLEPRYPQSPKVAKETGSAPAAGGDVNVWAGPPAQE